MPPPQCWGVSSSPATTPPPQCWGVCWNCEPHETPALRCCLSGIGDPQGKTDKGFNFLRKKLAAWRLRTSLPLDSMPCYTSPFHSEEDETISLFKVTHDSACLHKETRRCPIPVCSLPLQRKNLGSHLWASVIFICLEFLCEFIFVRFTQHFLRST